MEFDQEEISKLKPEDRISAQEYYIKRFNYKFRTHTPERRKPPKKWLPRNPRPWPRPQTWGSEVEANLRKLEKKKPMTTFVRRKRG